MQGTEMSGKMAIGMSGMDGMKAGDLVVEFWCILQISELYGRYGLQSNLQQPLPNFFWPQSAAKAILTTKVRACCERSTSLATENELSWPPIQVHIANFHYTAVARMVCRGLSWSQFHNLNIPKLSNYNQLHTSPSRFPFQSPLWDD